MYIYTVVNSDDIYEAIELRRKHLGLSQAQVGELAFNRSDTSPIQNIRRGSSPSVEKLAAIGDALGLEFYFGPKRDAPKSGVGRIQGFAEKALPDIKSAIDGSREALREGFLPIPYDISDPNSRGVAPVALSRAWISNMGLSPENLSFLNVTGDRMSPSLQIGSLALIEKNKKPSNLQIFAYIENGEIDFARISLPDKKTMVMAFDHPTAIPAVRVGKQCAAILILGRVVWTGYNLCDE